MKKLILSAAIMFALSASAGIMAQENKTAQKKEKAKTECCTKKEGDKKEACTKKEGEKKACCSKKSECKDKKVEKK